MTSISIKKSQERENTNVSIYYNNNVYIINLPRSKGSKYINKSIVLMDNYQFKYIHYYNNSVSTKIYQSEKEYNYIIELINNLNHLAGDDEPDQ